MQAQNQAKSDNGKGSNGKAPESKAPEASTANPAATVQASNSTLATESKAPSTDEGPQANPVQAGAHAYRSTLAQLTGNSKLYIATGKAMARTEARKAAKSAILAALNPAVKQ